MSLIFVAGLGSTGSSAICDLLSEFPAIYAPKQEWRIWADPNGLVQLAEKLTPPFSLFTSSTAYHSFRRLIRDLSSNSLGPYSHLRLDSDHAKAYRKILATIDSKLVNGSYSGLWYGNSNYFNSKLNFIFNRLFWKSNVVNPTMYLCNMNDSYQNVYTMLGTIVEEQLLQLALANRKDSLAINENFSIFFADQIFKMHPSSKIVLTLRSPLDVYADSYRVGWLAMPYAIRQFIMWQNHMYDLVKRLCNNYPNQILPIYFESLVMEYDSTTSKIFNFLNLDSSDHSPFQHFDPSLSIKNISQWTKTHPWLEEYRDEFHFLSYPIH